MTTIPLDAATRQRLEDLDKEALAIRKENRISNPGEIIWSGDTFDGKIVAEADGYGGATVSEVDGNYPVDYLTQRHQDCKTEEEACSLAHSWLYGGDDEEESDDDDDQDQQ